MVTASTCSMSHLVEPAAGSREQGAYIDVVVDDSCGDKGAREGKLSDVFPVARERGDRKNVIVKKFDGDHSM